MGEPLLQLEHLRVGYGSPPTNWAVDGVSLQLAAGEKLGLVGESGCGKSTLGRAIMRLLPQATVEGNVRVGGHSVWALDAARLRRFRGETAALIFQDPLTRLDPLMTVGDHCLETLRAHRPKLSQRQARARALETLRAVQIPTERWSQYPHEFSGGMRQRVAIALALLLEPQLIIADEPTTSLDVTVAAEILQLLARACEQRGAALLLVSHDLAAIGAYCERIAVMQAGQIVESGATAALLERPQHEQTRALLRSALQLQRPPEAAAETAARTEPPLLQVRELKLHYTLERNVVQQLVSRERPTIKAVDGVSFSLYRGETLGLVGESGCGKSTLSRAILQLVRPSAGTVVLQGQELTQLSARAMRRRRRQMQIVFQDPLACLNPLMPVGAIVAEPLRIHRLASQRDARAQARQMLEQVWLSPAPSYEQRYPRDLSGGQQQRVALARALITHPQLLICDEPVSMLDASVQAQVLALMQSLQAQLGLTYLFVTHDLAIARYLSDRIAVMSAGRIVELGPTQQIFAQPQHAYTQKLLRAAPRLAARA